MSTVARRLPDLDWETLAVWGAVLNAEFLLVLLYVASGPGTVTEPRYLVVPFVWLNVAGWGLLAVDPPDASRRRRVLGAAVGVAYFLLLGYLGGLWNLTGAGTGFRVVTSFPPGWGPAVLYSAAFTVVLVPFKFLGYVTLAYLVAVTVMDAVDAGSALTGAVGLLSCVSCTMPLLAGVLAGLAGGATGLANAATAGAYELSTLVFVGSVLLLVYRPGFGGPR